MSTLRGWGVKSCGVRHCSCLGLMAKELVLVKVGFPFNGVTGLSQPAVVARAEPSLPMNHRDSSA